MAALRAELMFSSLPCLLLPGMVAAQISPRRLPFPCPRTSCTSASRISFTVTRADDTPQSNPDLISPRCVDCTPPILLAAHYFQIFLESLFHWANEIFQRCRGACVDLPPVTLEIFGGRSALSPDHPREFSSVAMKYSEDVAVPLPSLHEHASASLSPDDGGRGGGSREQEYSWSGQM